MPRLQTYLNVFWFIGGIQKSLYILNHAEIAGASLSSVYPSHATCPNPNPYYSGVQGYLGEGFGWARLPKLKPRLVECN